MRAGFTSQVSTYAGNASEALTHMLLLLLLLLLLKHMRLLGLEV